MDDLLFLGSNIFFLLFPLLLGFLNRYSVYLQKHIKDPSDDEQAFQKSNTRFHILFRILTIGGMVVGGIYLVSIILINNKILHTNQLTRIDLSYFVFITVQILYTLLFIFSIFFSFLYFRFRPDYRHTFIQKLSVVLSVFVLIGSSINIVLHYMITKNLILPSLLTFTPNQSNFLLKGYNVLPAIILTLLFMVYSYVYTKFSRKRTLATSRLYFVIYLMNILGIILISVNASTKYFDLLSPGLAKQVVFSYTTAYAGIFWIYLSTLSFMSIIFSIFIYRKKDKFIGSQFAISYTLKLASINFYSTLSLFIITLMPWMLLQYYTYF